MSRTSSKNEVEMAGGCRQDLPGHPMIRGWISRWYICRVNHWENFVDIFFIDDSHLGMYIADVSGHGVQASLLTVFLRSAINKLLSLRGAGRALL